MFILKHLFFLIVIFSVGFIGQVQAETFRMGFFKLSPHAYSDQNNQPCGNAIQYFRLIAKQMGIEKVLFIELPLQRLVRHLKDGKVDAALILGKNSQREAIFIYPEKPFFNMQGSLALKKSHALKQIKSIKDILMLKVAKFPKSYCSPMMQDQRLKLIPINADDVILQSFKMILKDRIDAFYCPEIYSMKFKLKKENYKNKIRIIVLPEVSTGVFTPFSKQSAGKYLKKYETALTELSKVQSYTKKLDQLLSKGESSETD